MPIDASLYGQYAPRVRSPLEVQNDLAAQDAQRMQNALVGQKLQEYARGVQEQQVVRNALAGLGAQATDQDRVNALYGTGTQTGFQMGDTLQKSIGDRQRTQAQVYKDTAAGDKDKASTKTTMLGQYAQELSGFTDPKQTVDWYARSVKDGLKTPEQAQADIKVLDDAIKADPVNGFKNWQKQQLTSALTIEQQAIQARAAAEFEERKRQFGITSAETARAHRANEGIAAGQLALSRQREAREASAPRGIVVQGDNGPVLADPRTGQSVPIVDSSTGVPLGPKLKDVPQQVVQKVNETRQSISNIDQAIASVKANPDAFGISNAIPGVQTVKGYMGSQEGVAARATVANIGSLKLHDRSGAAVSASEFPRLQPFIPSASDNADTVVSKLTKMREIAESELSLYADSYGSDGGYKPLKTSIPTTGSSPAPTAYSDAAKEARYQAWKKANGK